jgi:Family of unknown function (DUF5995)
MESAEQVAESGAGGPHWFDRAGVPLRPSSAEEALRALDVVTEALFAEGDARAVFPDIYGIITRRVTESVMLGERGVFHEPRWISRLAGRFCERYLQTLRWSMDRRTQDASAWELAYAAVDSDGTLPLQHVLLGLSAHINFDLAMGIYRTIVEFGAFDAGSLRRYKHDHDVVNDLLRASIPEAFDHLVTRHRCEGATLLFNRAYVVAEWAAMRILSTWRARVWDDAMAMLRARSAGERERIVEALERRSRRLARMLGLPGFMPLSLRTTPGTRGRSRRSHPPVRASAALSSAIP